MGTARPRPLVLVVDDVEDARVLAQATLPLLGFDVALAADGFEAVARAREVHPDIVLLDICMPRLDGYGALALLKADPATAGIPVVAYTARTDEEDRVRTAGFAGWCVKPCLPDQLAAALRRVLAGGPA